MTFVLKFFGLGFDSRRLHQLQYNKKGEIIVDQNVALTTLVQGVTIAQKRGAYDLKEASVLAESVAAFTQTQVTETEEEEGDTVDKTNE